MLFRIKKDSRSIVYQSRQLLFHISAVTLASEVHFKTLKCSNDWIKCFLCPQLTDESCCEFALPQRIFTIVQLSFSIRSNVLHHYLQTFQRKNLNFLYDLHLFKRNASTCVEKRILCERTVSMRDNWRRVLQPSEIFSSKKRKKQRRRDVWSIPLSLLSSGQFYGSVDIVFDGRD